MLAPCMLQDSNVLELELIKYTKPAKDSCIARYKSIRFEMQKLYF